MAWNKQALIRVGTKPTATLPFGVSRSKVRRMLDKRKCFFHLEWESRARIGISGAMPPSLRCASRGHVLPMHRSQTLVVIEDGFRAVIVLLRFRCRASSPMAQAPRSSALNERARRLGFSEYGLTQACCIGAASASPAGGSGSRARHGAHAGGFMVAAPKTTTCALTSGCCDSLACTTCRAVWRPVRAGEVRGSGWRSFTTIELWFARARAHWLRCCRDDGQRRRTPH
jgi:hypothetical protein